MFLKIEKIKIFKFICVAATLLLLFGANLALAQPTDGEKTDSDASGVRSGLENTAEAAGIPKTGGEEAIPNLIGSIIMGALGSVGIIFLILMIIGGVMWMTASGNEERVNKAKGLITNAVIGMIIVFSAYAITYFVTETLLGTR
ncbi:hypothetical protein HZB93_04215 [Candidatus Falkowbacteria bacterium]|nr:hypothetical protein [Candidatus Falkowbacteria bacterium]